MANPPPTNPIRPPTPGDVKSGYKMSIKDLSDILSGAYPGELWTDTAVDTISMDAVPDGMHRVLIIAHGYGDADQALPAMVISRMGVDYVFGTETMGDLSTIGVDAVVYNQNIPKGITLRSLILRAGDVLTFVDLATAGGNVVLSVMYVDVFI